jgi:hypothetical protein
LKFQHKLSPSRRAEGQRGGGGVAGSSWLSGGSGGWGQGSHLIAVSLSSVD